MTNVCNKILYKRTPYKEEQTSNWSVSMTCLSLVRKGRKVSKSKHQLIIQDIQRCLSYGPVHHQFLKPQSGKHGGQAFFSIGIHQLRLRCCLMV